MNSADLLSYSNFIHKKNIVTVQSTNGYSARAEISDRRMDNREWVVVESGFKGTANGGVVSIELRLAVKKKEVKHVQIHHG